ncbi:hypothetical protein SELMODRAFT_406260 [Selaginella moellendorffii]|uniref:ABC transporter domain-containing protein n=1 Tax=Selaginella moellendorffii TaxID=88036 RepID=D8R1T0_SELML|nr:hypothetical protein SELMODRAFT_406260 [Selaginella moellendorffii]
MARPIWWKGDEAVTLDQSPSQRSSYYGEEDENYDFSFQSSFQASPMARTIHAASSPMGNAGFSPSQLGNGPDRVFVVPVRGSETPITRSKIPPPPRGRMGSTTPEIERRLANAEAGTVQGAALEMYRVLKKNGLAAQAEKAIKRLNSGISGAAAEESLLGMEFILKDGIVSFLRELSKLAPPVPQQVVRFSGVRLSVSQEQALGYETFGGKLLGCFLGPLRNLLLDRKTIKRKIEVLKDLDGFIMPGSTTLLLGPPGSGKSSLLKVLAGRCESNKTTKLQGIVSYNDRLASEVVLTRLIAYVNGQVNRHLPFLTVRETLEFAGDCTQGVRPKNFSPSMRRYFAQALVQGQDPYLEYVLHVLGLKAVEDKLVGIGQDGLSETNRHRLTSAELAIGTYAVMIYDQPCYEQDSQATYDLVFTLRAISRIQRSSAVMSLVQVSPEVFELFDRVIVLGDGQILYQGPRQDVLDYFSVLGFSKPSHVDTAAFLQDIGAGEGGQYVKGNRQLYGIEELVEAYKSSDLYKDIVRIVSSDDVAFTYWVEHEPSIGLSVRKSSNGAEVVVSRLSTKVDQAQGIESTGHIQEGDIVTGISLRNGRMQYIAVGSKITRKSYADDISKVLEGARGHVRLQVERRATEQEVESSQPAFVQTWWESTKTVTKRQLRFATRLKILVILRLIQVVILGIFGGAIFYSFGGSLDPGEMNIVRAIGFVSTFSIMLVNVVQLPVHMIQRPALLYSIPVYFLARLSLEEAGLHYIQFFWLLALVAYMGSFLVIFLSTITPVLEAGNALAGLVVSLGLLFSGFVIFPSLTPSYWKWMLSANPLRWGNVIFCMAEFLNRYHESCQDFQQLLFCRKYPDLPVGRAYLEFFQLVSERKWMAISFAIIAASVLILALASYLGLSKVVFSEVSPSLPSEPARSSYKQPEDKQKDISWDGLSRITEMSNLQTKTVWEKNGSTHDDEELGLGLELRGTGHQWENSHIPVKAATLSFHQVSFSVKAEEKIVLDRVSGFAKPGTMLAIIGSMGSGKSTLLRVLAGRTLPSSSGELISGEVLVNGFNLSSNTFRRLSGFVERVDAHQPFLTVKESLDFSAGLRFGGSTTPGRRAFHVELVLELMGLVGVKDQLVGSLKFSNGKIFELAKKLTIAVELAANPSMIFLEDPTSDLDSVATRNILFAIQTVAASGRTVISTIQQPSARVLSAFNNVLIMRPGGEQVYFGPVGWNCGQLLEYFTTMSSAPKYEQSQNPVTYMFDIIRKDEQNLGLVYRASSLGSSNAEELKKLRKQYRKNSFWPALDSTYAAPYSKQAWLVFLRTQRFLYRNVQYTFGRLSGSIALGLLLGSVYYKIATNDTFSVTSRSLFIYIQVMLLGVIIANNVVPQLGTDRLVYHREQRAAMYAPIFYPVSWAIAEIPYLFIATLVFVGISNGLAAIATQSVSSFVTYWLCLFVFTTTVMYFGMFITIATPVPVLAAFVVSITNSIWVSASGVIVPKAKMGFCEWVFWANPFQYVTHALTSVSFFCDTASAACASCRVGDANSCAGCHCPRLLNAESSDPGSLPVFVWDRLSSQRSLEVERVSLDFVALGGMSVLFALLSFLAFVWMKHNRG